MTVPPARPNLPVTEVLPALLAALVDGDAGRRPSNAVLVAPPGAGKTTLVPLAVVEQPWCTGTVLVLEPRRLAARAAAARMAHLLGERVGEVVGYRVRGETQVGPRTRIQVVTEGILPRMLHDDPSLAGVSAVLLDEFHERSLDADLGLALCLDVQGALRPDLRLVVMSATIDPGPVAALLGGDRSAAIVRSEGRIHPVETRFVPTGPDVPWERAMTAAVVGALGETAGDVLGFCPGAGEIARVSTALGERPGVAVLPLHGSLPLAEQDAALRPDAAGRRKVVLGTSIAETSLTIDGVRVVVDGGLARVPRFDVRRGMGRLETVRVTRAAADQRRGRAGRQAPGTCYRLWSAAEDDRLLAAEQPEILVADLAPLALDLARWGTPDGSGLAWLDPPPVAALADARALLLRLGAIEGVDAPGGNSWRKGVDVRPQPPRVRPAGRLTAHGAAMGELGVHPRLAHLLVTAAAAPADLATAALVAALLGERDVLVGAAASSADLRERLDALTRRRGDEDLHRATVERVRRDADRLLARLAGGPRRSSAATATRHDDVGRLVALAYPERIAQRRPGSHARYRLSSGAGATLDERDPMAGSPYLAVADLDAGPAGRSADARIRLAAPLDEDDVREVGGLSIAVVDEVGWAGDRGDVVAARVVRLGALELERTVRTDLSPDQYREALLAGVRAEGVGLLPWTPPLLAWRARVRFLHRVVGVPWPDLGDETLAATADRWLGPFLDGASRRADLARVDLAGALGTLLPWPLPAQLDELAPERLTVPSGSSIRVDYAPDPPVLAVKLQEMFGATDTPRLADGRVPVLIHLLSPAGRPLQVTQDLASFWRGPYTQVRAEMRGRYPKHPWPDNPLTAPPTSRARPRP